ncbi:hypothetical protein EON80_30190, partial [bacterium]
MRNIFLAFILLATTYHSASPARAQLPTVPPTQPLVDPLQLTFYRQSVKRSIFSSNMPLTTLTPAEIVDLDLMHPVVTPATTPCAYALSGGKLEIRSGAAPAESARYVGGINPYATYEADIQSIDSTGVSEIALDWS